MRERKNWLEIDDYLYSCKNLDGDEKIILSAIISFENAGKALYMSRDTFSNTYGMSISTVKRKFVSLLKNNLIKDTGKGLKIDWDELEFFVNIQKKLKTKSAGPGRKKNQSGADVEDYNRIKLTPTENQVDAEQRINMTPQRINMTPPKNQVDTELLKDNNSILQKKIKKDITSKTSFDESFFNDVDLEKRFNYKAKEEYDIKKQKITSEDLAWLDELDI